LLQSLLKENHTEHTTAEPLSEHLEISSCCAEISSVNCHCDLTSDDRRTLSEAKLSQIRSLLQDVDDRQHDCKLALQRTKLASGELSARKNAVCNAITSRADYLCQLILSRRDELFDELERVHSQSGAEYSERISTLGTYSRNLKDSSQFAESLLAAGNASVELESDVLARLNYLVMCDTPTRVPDGVPEITAMRLDVPDGQHEESHLEKLFGSLTKGTVGTVELVKSFTTDLHWPTGFVVSRNHEMVLAGKPGAFAEGGRVTFYDSRGVCTHSHSLPAGHVPIDVVGMASGHVLVSDVSGRITKFTSCGGLLVEWTKMFEGANGHMAVIGGSDQLLVNSAAEFCIHCYREMDGQRLRTFTLQWPPDITNTMPDITAVAINSRNEVIITASNLRNPYFFTFEGYFMHICSTTDQGIKTDPDAYHGVVNGLNASSFGLPSAVCCDSFDNILVADFLSNCVHLLSSSGAPLGRLLTKTHGVACPTFLALDHDDRLYVGQYGGEVVLFRYLSCVKHV